MALNLKLSQKGLILVAVPLVFEIAFVGGLAYMLREAEKEIFREHHFRSIYHELHKVIQNIYTMGMTFKDERFRGGDFLDFELGEEIDTVVKTINSLRTLVKDDLEFKPLVNAIADSTEECAKILRLTIEDARLHPEQRRDFVARAKKAMEPHLDTLKTSAATLGTIGKDIEANSPQRQKQNRDNIVSLLLAGLVLNVLMAVFLALYFNKGTAERLRTVVQNTTRFAHGQPLTPPLTGGDEIAHLDGVFRDMVKSLKEVEQMKQEFVQMVSHDLRTPLTSVQAFHTLLATGMYGPLNKEGMDLLKTADNSLGRLIRLINELLDIERIEAGQLEVEKTDVALNSVLDKSIAALQGVASKSDVKLECEKTSAIVLGDEDRLIQVVINLVSNAIKFSPAGGTVQITINSPAKEVVEVRIQDQGRGVPAHLKERIFERFKQVEKEDSSVKGGTGLGLPICKAIVEAHGGMIGVDSTEGNGSTFWFQIPYAPSYVETLESIDQPV